MKHAAWGFVAAAAAVAAALAFFAFSALDDGRQPDAPPDPAAGGGSATTTTPERPGGSASRAARPTGPEAAAPRGPFGRGTAELLHHAEHGDAAAATTTFGKPRRGKGELVFGKDGGDEFGVRLAPEDRSVIVDLGPGTLREVAAGGLRLFVPPDARERVPAVEGHVYAVRTKDADSDRVSLFRVDALVPRDRVRITWVDSRPAEGALPAGLDGDPEDFDRVGARLADLGRRTAGEPPVPREIADGEPVILQIRKEVGDTKESLVTLGAVSGWHRVTEISESAFDVTASAETTRGWTNRQVIPKDRAWVIEGIDVWARAPGEPTSHGDSVAVRLLDTEIFRTRGDDRPFSGWWEGRLILLPGDESRVVVAVSAKSSAEVRLHGRLIPADQVKAMQLIPFWPAIPPAGAARAGGGRSSAQRTNLLEEPRFSLQIACDGSSGGEVWVTLAGSYKDSVWLERAPFAIDTWRGKDGEFHTWSPAVRIPRDRTLVVTRVAWRGRAEGDANANGGARIAVAGTTILDSEQTQEALAGDWSGQIRVESGHEAEVLAAVRNRSALDVTFEGWLEVR